MATKKAVKPRTTAMQGEFVNYYPSGTVDGGKHLVVVDEAFDSGVIRASHLKERQPAINGIVRHISDPHLVQHPQQRSREGAWDFHPVHRMAFDYYHEQKQE